MCDNRNHNLEEIIRIGTYDNGVYKVVNWCSDCGAIVIDGEIDGRIYPGRYMKIRFPKEIKKKIK